MTTKTQVEILRDHLLRVGTISGLEASGMYRVRALPRRIKDLKDRYGMRIVSVHKKDATGQRYVRYALAASSMGYTEFTGGVYA